MSARHRAKSITYRPDVVSNIRPISSLDLRHRTDVGKMSATERRRGPVVGRSLWTRPARVQSTGWDIIN